MARSWLAPNSACILVASGCAIGSQGHYCWLLLAADDTAACATFFGSPAATVGRQLVTLTAGACQSTGLVGPFRSPSGIYVRLSGTGASATVALD